MFSKFLRPDTNKKILMCSGSIPSNRILAKYLNISRKSGYITNGGPLVKRLESKLAKESGCDHTVVTSSGTMALTLLLKTLVSQSDVSCKEVITTPFTFIATASAIIASGCKPIFVDLQHDSCFVNNDKVGQLINNKTLCVLVTHVYGYNAAQSNLQSICSSKSIPLIFDAAHAYGCMSNEKNLLKYGTASIISMHATKTLSAAEGGAIFTDNKQIAQTASSLRDFNYKADALPANFEGLNGKMSELHAAIGLHSLSTYQERRLSRKTIAAKLIKGLKSISNLTCLHTIYSEFNLAHYNYSYFPVRFDNLDDAQFAQIIRRLAGNNIFARRYFFPSLDKLTNDQYCPESVKFSERMLCLPCHSELQNSEVDRIIETLTL